MGAARPGRSEGIVAANVADCECWSRTVGRQAFDEVVQLAQTGQYDVLLKHDQVRSLLVSSQTIFEAVGEYLWKKSLGSDDVCPLPPMPLASSPGPQPPCSLT